MNKKHFLAVILAVFLMIVIIAGVPGCTVTISADNLMKGVHKNTDIKAKPIDVKTAAAVADFGVKLLKAANVSGKNILLSPVSVLASLSMTANGAKNNTLLQMEKTFGVGIDELNDFFKTYLSSLPQDGKNKLRIANSIWVNKRSVIDLSKDFLQKNADYYNADAYSTVFDDNALEDINNWVKIHTGNMIKDVTDSIKPEEDTVFLLNVLSFDAEWKKPYKEGSDEGEGDFTNENGIKTKVMMLFSEESLFIETELSKGFVKPYANGKYAFAALLPNKGVSMEAFIDSLDGNKLVNALSGRSEITVSAEMPKFKTSYSADLSHALEKVGLKDAFSGAEADFSGIGSSQNPLFIGGVIHKTFISVAERGTKAAAVSGMKVCVGGIGQEIVLLNRPFVYMLIDLENNIPFFIGKLADV